MKLSKHVVSVWLAVGAIVVGCSGHDCDFFVLAIILIEFFA